MDRLYTIIVVGVPVALIALYTIVSGLNEALGIPYTEVPPRLIEMGILVAVLATTLSLYRGMQSDKHAAEDREEARKYRDQRLANDKRILHALKRIEVNRSRR